MLLLGAHDPPCPPAADSPLKKGGLNNQAIFNLILRCRPQACKPRRQEGGEKIAEETSENFRLMFAYYCDSVLI